MFSTHLILIALYAAVAGLAVWAGYIFWRRQVRGRGIPPRPLTQGLKKTQSRMAGRLGTLFTGHAAIDDAFLAGLEETLISADVGIETCGRLLDQVRDARTPKEARLRLREGMIALFTSQPEPQREVAQPTVLVILGVNGVGKTTSIAKLAYRYQCHGKRVLLAAADTYRAAAVDQLKVWGRRLGCDVVAQGSGADPASVAYDAVAKARAKGHDVVLVDTAGRLHTKNNLMAELSKIDRVIGKAQEGAPHERWLVLDATVGQNGLAQVREFHQALDLTGVIVTKLDGTARGGIVCSITELGIPVVSIGVGEGMRDLRPFDPRLFVDAILGIDEVCPR